MNGCICSTVNCPHRSAMSPPTGVPVTHHLQTGSAAHSKCAVLGFPSVHMFEQRRLKQALKGNCKGLCVSKSLWIESEGAKCMVATDLSQTASCCRLLCCEQIWLLRTAFLGFGLG